jgi:hypothetical protein
MYISQRLDYRLVEMKERKKKLSKNSQKVYDEDNKLDANIKKLNAIQAFASTELEDMLRNTTKNTAHDIISCLIDKNSGILSRIEGSIKQKAQPKRRTECVSIINNIKPEISSIQQIETNDNKKLGESNQYQKIDALYPRSKELLLKRKLCHTPTYRNDCSATKEDSIISDASKEFKISGLARIKGMAYKDRPHLVASHTFYRPASLSPYKCRRKL